MSVEPAPARNGRSGRATRLRWHRRVGLASAALFLVVAATGVLLNHAEDLGLRGRVLRAGWLYRWYGMQPETPPVGYRVGNHWIISVGRSTYLDSRPVLDLGPIVGAVVGADLFAVATSNELALLAADGSLVEKLTAIALPSGPIIRLGASTDRTALLLETPGGTFSSDRDVLSWKHEVAPSSAAIWSAPEPLPEALASAVLTAYRGEGLTLHRVILDLHSGRFFGRAGVVVVDLTALGLLFLVASGLWYAVTARSAGR